ncbi:MAG: hypothetical protein P8N73_07295 [Pseudomonadales bacterium]|nr:hypothetical protein [Pseudomonadales bacterium]
MLNTILKEKLVVMLGSCGDSVRASPFNDSGLGTGPPNAAGELGTHLFIQEFFSWH